MCFAQAEQEEKKRKLEAATAAPPAEVGTEGVVEVGKDGTFDVGSVDPVVSVFRVIFLFSSFVGLSFMLTDRCMLLHTPVFSSRPRPVALVPEAHGASGGRAKTIWRS